MSNTHEHMSNTHAHNTRTLPHPTPARSYDFLGHEARCSPAAAALIASTLRAHPLLWLPDKGEDAAPAAAPEGQLPAPPLQQAHVLGGAAGVADGGADGEVAGEFVACAQAVFFDHTYVVEALLAARLPLRVVSKWVAGPRACCVCGRRRPDRLLCAPVCSSQQV